MSSHVVPRLYASLYGPSGGRMRRRRVGAARSGGRRRVAARASPAQLAVRRRFAALARGRGKIPRGTRLRGAGLAPRRRRAGGEALLSRLKRYGRTALKFLPGAALAGLTAYGAHKIATRRTGVSQHRQFVEAQESKRRGAGRRRRGGLGPDAIGLAVHPLRRLYARKFGASFLNPRAPPNVRRRRPLGGGAGRQDLYLDRFISNDR